VLSKDKIDGQIDGSFYGNIGRCLWFKDDIVNALICYRKSIQLLDASSNVNTTINRGWGNMWIGEALQKQEKYILAWYFYRRAYLAWIISSPPKAEIAQEKANVVTTEYKVQITKISDSEVEEQCRQWIDVSG
jgi:hypothetical protein